MNKFAVGDYIIHENGKTIHRYVSLNYMEQLKPRCDHTKKYLIRIRHIGMYRKATVLDYIRTMDAERMAMFLYDINHGNTTINFHDYPNQEHIKWLKQPLTDAIIKQLGGVDND